MSLSRYTFDNERAKYLFENKTPSDRVFCPDNMASASLFVNEGEGGEVLYYDEADRIVTWFGYHDELTMRKAWSNFVIGMSEDVRPGDICIDADPMRGWFVACRGADNPVAEGMTTAAEAIEYVIAAFDVDQEKVWIAHRGRVYLIDPVTWLASLF